MAILKFCSIFLLFIFPVCVIGLSENVNDNQYELPEQTAIVLCSNRTVDIGSLWNCINSILTTNRTQWLESDEFKGVLFKVFAREKPKLRTDMMNKIHKNDTLAKGRLITDTTEYKRGVDYWIKNIFARHYIKLSTRKNNEEGRARHRRNQALPIMIFAMTALGMVLVPVGFQLLAVLGGKALLLSKMALFLASMNGLKKVATSGIHYGLYHSETGQHGPFERRESVTHSGIATE